jgi:hypothetical protein
MKRKTFIKKERELLEQRKKINAEIRNIRDNMTGWDSWLLNIEKE